MFSLFPAPWRERGRDVCDHFSFVLFFILFHLLFILSLIHVCGRNLEILPYLLFCTQEMSLGDLKQWASGRMVPYQIPTVLLVVDELPRNTMGKVNKKELNTLFFGKEWKRTNTNIKQIELNLIYKVQEYTRKCETIRCLWYSTSTQVKDMF